MTDVKATIIFKSDFMGNVIVRHVHLRDHGRCKYAQYNSAPFVIYKEKRKRRYFKKVVTNRDAFLIILDGWVDIESQDIFGPVKRDANGLAYQEGKFCAFDDGFKDEFLGENDLSEYETIADYRGVNIYENICNVTERAAKEKIQEVFDDFVNFHETTIRGENTLEVTFSSIYNTKNRITVNVIKNNGLLEVA